MHSENRINLHTKRIKSHILDFAQDPWKATSQKGNKMLIGIKSSLKHIKKKNGKERIKTQLSQTTWGKEVFE